MARPASESTALWVLRTLRDAKHQAVFAGGCVRDRLIGIPSVDYDIATDARPKKIRKLFPHVLMVGAQFGVAVVVHHGEMVEVATFRSDAAYSDGRRPDRVKFSSPKEDALRRDFTINGMFYDPIDDEIIDYVGGREDLDARIIRTIGNPDDRFSEDYLRLIRAVRFATRLDFQIEPATEAAIARLADRIQSVSGERVFDELHKMLSHPSAMTALKELERLGLMRYILPELFDAPELWPAAVARAEGVAHCVDFVLTLTALLAEAPGMDIASVIRRWGAPNDTRDAVQWMARHRSDWRDAPDWSLAQLKRVIAHPQFNRLCLLWLTLEQIETGQADCHRMLRERIHTLDPLKIAPAPLVSGQDLLEMGLTEGPRLGSVLQQVYDAQLNEEIGTREAALSAARRLAEPFLSARA